MYDVMSKIIKATAKGLHFIRDRCFTAGMILAAACNSTPAFSQERAGALGESTTAMAMVQAENYAVAFLANQEAVNQRSMVAIRSQIVAVDKRGLRSRDDLFLVAQDENEKLHYFADISTSERPESASTTPLWEEKLSVGGTSVAYRGVGVRDGELLNRKKLESAVTFHPSFDPLSAIFGSTADWGGRGMHKGHASNLFNKLVQQFDAERDENGNVVGIWKIGEFGTMVFVVFDRKQGNMPSKVIFKIGNNKDPKQLRESGRIFIATTVKWTFENGEFWVPEQIRIIENASEEMERSVEWTMKLKWLIGEKEVRTLPSFDDESWMEPFVGTLIDDHWQLVEEDEA